MNGITKFIGWLAVALFLYGFWFCVLKMCFYLGVLLTR